MSTNEGDESRAPLSREELIALVSRAHFGSSVHDHAGAALAAQSRLPKRVAENLGAGLGQWDFFPEVSDIVDFALGYVPPTTPEELWALARAWASDDAAARPTLMTLIGRDILDHELRRIDVPALRELVDEPRPARARALRTELGLEVPPLPQPKAAGAARANRATKSAPAAPKREAPTRMPKPDFKPPPKAPPPPDAKRYRHPKFGEGVLRAQDGTGPEAKLTIEFASGPKTLLARFVTEILP
ncbi:MAG TPA: hypothetical protein VHK47_11450 [Polyangia bacterium]|nr:hypothetical protein [Polyangia bacterium]